MYSVLYTNQLEPITVLQLNPSIVEYLTKKGTVTIPVLMNRALFFSNSKAPYDPQPSFVQVRITAEIVQFRQRKVLILVTEDEEPALLLKAAFLPGQRKELQSKEAKSFGEGFLEAFQFFQALKDKE